MKFTIDGQEIEAKNGQTILKLALAAGLYIPHLCYHPDLPSFEELPPESACYRGQEIFHTDIQEKGYQGCGLCLVEVKGKEEPVLSCVTSIEEEMEVMTSSALLEKLRQKNLASILVKHPHACLICAQREGCSLTQCSTNVPEEDRCCPQFDFCELRKVSEYIGIKEDIPRYVPQNLYSEVEKPLFIQDYNLCVGCLRCVRVCSDVIGAKALGYTVVNNEIIFGTKRPSLEESGCRFCGACAEVCPTGCIRDREIKPGNRRNALVPCVAACPVGMDIPSYVRFISMGKDVEAADLIMDRVPLPLTLGYICHHPCEDECRRKDLNQAIAICDLKRFALENTQSEPQTRKKEATGKKVAIVGSGPTGLVAAYFLAKLGHSVEVFEAQPEPGGMLRWAIPEYRLPHDVIKKEIEHIKTMGVKIHTNARIDKENFLEELSQKKWDALFLATGAQESKKIDIEGLPSERVYWGLDFLREAKRGKRDELKGKIVVIGGGNVAMDVAMTALRLSASSVNLSCLEKREEMPAFTWEIAEAEEEGVVIHPGWGPYKIERKENKIKGIELVACTSVFDKKVYFCPEFDESERMFLYADKIILAVGQKTDMSFLPPDSGIKITEEETIKINHETLETDVRGVFAGGEATLGQASAVETMALGRRAASSIDSYLGGEGIIDFPAPKEQEENLWMGEEEGFASKERASILSLPLEKRLCSFDLIQLGYSKEEARYEASRCLRCDQRFRFSPVILPPERWLEFKADVISQVPESEGAFELLDQEKNIIFIGSSFNLKQALDEQLASNPDARYFIYEEDPMYTKRESELIQQYLQKHGHLPPGNEDVEDLF